ncbi:MAG TPA: beta-N-acetylhexosaminidase, partial [Paenibacillus sp.]|nr:beta-N-acetylhexosaminidase [Paenibacillus sp.]
EAATELACVGCAEHLAVARGISERSVTLVRNRGGVLPLRRERTLAITVAAAAQTIADEAVRASAGLGAALAALGLDCRDECVDVAPSEARIAELAAIAQGGGWAQIVVGVYNAGFHLAQKRLVEALQASGARLVVVALRNPYDLAAFPDADGCVAVYENRPLSLASAAKALLGDIPFRGALPVSLGEAYPAGWRGDGA